MSKPANNKVSGKKRKAPPNAWKKGQSGNPAGAPKRGESWAEVIKRYGEMTPGQAAESSLELAKKFLSIGEGVTLKQAVVLRAFATLIFDSDARLLATMMDRAEGKVSQPVEVYDWRKDIADAGGDPDALLNDLFSKVTNSGKVTNDTGNADD